MMRHRTWNFDIDRFVNPLIPPPPWPLLPRPLARFLGHRATTPRATGNLLAIFWAFVGILGAILVIEAVSRHLASFEARGVPVIVGSFGAAAVLEFYAIESPLAQPRNAILGQLLSTVVGVGIAKLLLLSSRFDDVQWVGGALACASATALMALTKTVHPPAGATALLAVVDARLVAVGWFLIPIIMLGCALMLGVALLVNNVERQFPMYWWTPEDLRNPACPGFRRRRPGEVAGDDIKDDNAGAGGETTTVAAHDGAAVSSFTGGSDTQEDTVSQAGQDLEKADGSVPGMTKTTAAAHRAVTPRDDVVVIKPGQVIVPEHMFLTPEEEQLLESMSYRL